MEFIPRGFCVDTIDSCVIEGGYDYEVNGYEVNGGLENVFLRIFQFAHSWSVPENSLMIWCLCVNVCFFVFSCWTNESYDNFLRNMSMVK